MSWSVGLLHVIITSKNWHSTGRIACEAFGNTRFQSPGTLSEMEMLCTSSRVAVSNRVQTESVGTHEAASLSRRVKVCGTSSVHRCCWTKTKVDCECTPTNRKLCSAEHSIKRRNQAIVVSVSVPLPAVEEV